MTYIQRYNKNISSKDPTSLDNPSRIIETKAKNPLLLEAKELVSKEMLDWFQDDKWKVRLTNLFKEYVNEVEGKVLILHNLNDQALILPYITRASPSYIKKLKRRLKSLKDLSMDNGIFLTLTTGPRLFASLLDAYQGLMKNFHKLMMFLKKRLGNLRYISVIELTKSGLPHLHVVILGINYLIPQDELSQIWSKYGQGIIVDIRRIGKGFRGYNVFKYVLKYLVKVWDIQDYKPHNLFHVSCLWALGARAYNCSRGLIPSKPKPEPKGWVYLGSYFVLTIVYALDLPATIIDSPIIKKIDYERLCSLLSV
jgi:hypothetical protein